MRPTHDAAAHDTVFERQRPAAAAVEQALAGARRSAFWLDDIALSRTRFEALRHTIDADLVIVGGGYTGLWSALRALERQPDARVVVLEAGRVGWAASGRNGGFCEASITHGDENGENRWPDEMQTLRRLGDENLDAIEQTVARYGMKCDFERTGTLTVAIEPHQVDWVQGDGFLDEAAVRAEVASPTYLAGSWNMRSTALVHPAKLVTELARVVTERGGQIFEGSRVVGLGGAGRRAGQSAAGAWDPAGASGTAGASAASAASGASPGSVTVRTASGGTVRAARAVLATNVFPSLLKRNRGMTVPVYDYALMTEPLSDHQLASIGWSNRQGIADLANQFHYYRLSADNRILFGGYDAVYHFGSKVRPSYEERASSYSTLASHFLTTFPQLTGIRFANAWAGPIDTSTRFCAFFGTARGGSVAYAAGFTGLGVGASRFAADVVLDLLSGQPTERTELRMVRERPLPFPPEPAASIGINLTRWSLDRADHRAGKRNLLLRSLDAVGLGFDS
ncbi:NAD(P)/FAD-dependent oxidoreductase [Subtercola endophyticus]|uniref:NAD(P)/FAD-dependent oxidoreductase n=1 Tax=Subtercola endophyticus TaxID=2895559 RepID=UPI001E55A5BC|nr:FAD-dependent oxidoreductase [Subtercola endophyticus]UFS58805.1 FAD-binding oxidoreductase [Subtercola endophyticus]